MVDIEVLQKSFMESMDSMQKTFDKERKELEEKIKNLEKDNKLLNDMFVNIKNENQILKDSNSNAKFLEQLKEKEISEYMLKGELTKKTEEINKKTDEINELKKKNKELLSTKANGLIEKEQIIQSLEKEIKEKKKEYELKIKEMEGKIDFFSNQFSVEEKLNMQLKNEIKGLEEEKQKQEKNINDLKEENKKKEKKINELYEYIKKVKEEEEKNKIEEEKLRNEREKFEKEKMEEKKKREKEYKHDEEIKDDQNKKMDDMNDEKKNKFLCDILSEFLVKLNNSQYFITTFDLLNQCLKNYDELNYFKKMSLKYNQKINYLLFNFFTDLDSYIILNGPNSNLNHFLQQKKFKYSEIDKDSIEIIKKIGTVKLGENNIKDNYKKKKEHFLQKVGLTFDILKEKIINDNQKINTDNFPELLKLNQPPTVLGINFDKINLNNLSIFITFQINNILSKLEFLSIEMSKVNLDILCSFILNCINLKSIKIVLNSKQNLTNVEILNNIAPIILTYLPKITEFSYSNIMLLNNYLPEIANTIKNSKLKKLILNNCFTSNEDIEIFHSYFAGSNDLEEIDFSNHNFNIPVLLNNSLLNYTINKKLISINFNNCCLKDEDFEVISKYVTDNNSFKCCNLGNNTISQKSCFKLGTMIERTTSLEQLILNNCQLNGETILLLLNNKGSNTLKYININDNEISDIGLVGISAFVKSSPKLEILELANVGGSDMGFSTLVNCVKFAGNIKIVHFERNKITKKSVDIIKQLNEELKNKNIKFFVDKMNGENDMDSLKFI